MGAPARVLGPRGRAARRRATVDRVRGDDAPGYFFSAGEGVRPLVVIDHGGRVATSEAWAAGGAAAHARGYHWMTFDGPGRQAALRRQGLVLRPDWEAVLGPSLDAMLARADVDA